MWRRYWSAPHYCRLYFGKRSWSLGILARFQSLISSVFFWFMLNLTALCLLLLLKFFFGFFSGPMAADVFDVLFNIVSGGMISFLFYFLVVHVPERRRARVLKDNAIAVYRGLRGDLVTAVVMASVKGGRKDLSTSLDEIERLTNVDAFKAQFSSGRLSHEGYYAFENQMSHRTYEFERIIQDFKILASEPNFFLHNYPGAEAEHFMSLKRLEISLAALIDSQPGYDESKQLCSFLYSFLAGFDLLKGYLGRDVYLEALERI